MSPIIAVIDRPLASLMTTGGRFSQIFELLRTFCDPSSLSGRSAKLLLMVLVYHRLLADNSVNNII